MALHFTFNFSVIIGPALAAGGSRPVTVKDALQATRLTEGGVAFVSADRSDFGTWAYVFGVGTYSAFKRRGKIDKITATDNDCFVEAPTNLDASTQAAAFNLDFWVYF